MSKRRLLFCIHSLTAGGAERVLGALANRFAEEDEVHLLTLRGPGRDHYRLDGRITRHTLSKDLSGEATVPPWTALARLRGVIRAVGPDAMVSFMCRMNLLCLAARAGLGTPVVVSIRNDMRRWRVSPLLRLMMRLGYPRAEGVAVQTESVAAWARDFVAPPRIRVIPNPVSPAIPDHAGSGGERVEILAMGRLVAQKGFDVLLRALARLDDTVPPWRLTIHGEGEARAGLTTLAGELGLAGRVRLPGVTDEPFEAFRTSDLFVLPSRFEGFPNVLLEAMACGLPVVAADCMSGPREMIADGTDGLLVPPEDPEALAGVLRAVLVDPPLRARLGAAARRVRERYGLEAVAAEWRTVIDQAVGSA